MAYIGSKRLLNITSKGDSAYIRYSAYPDGTDFTATRSEGQNYIGFATAQKAPTDKNAYTWIKNSELIANVVQNLGNSGTAVMSQKAVTDEIGKFNDIFAENVVSLADFTTLEDEHITYKDKRNIEIKNGSGDLVLWLEIPNIDPSDYYYVRAENIETDGTANIKIFNDAKKTILSMQAGIETLVSRYSGRPITNPVYVRLYIPSNQYLKITNFTMFHHDIRLDNKFDKHIKSEFVSCETLEKHIQTQNVIETTYSRGTVNSSTGEITPYDSAWVTDFIPIKKGYKYTNTHNYNFKFVAYYDTIKKFIRQDIEVNTTSFEADIDGYVRIWNYNITYGNIIEYKDEFKNIPALYESIMQNAGNPENGIRFNHEAHNVPTLYFTGNITGMSKDNKVTLDYVFGDRSGTCTLKWQGNSSLTFPKKNYTVVFDEAFEATSYATSRLLINANWGNQKKYVLKADWVDFSHCRNVVSAKLWGTIIRSRSDNFDKLSKLKALPNGGAIDGFPCYVVINGEWQGIYNFNIPKDGWMLGMGEGTQEAIVCADWTGDKCAFKTTVDQRTDSGTDDFETEYVTDEDNSAWVQTNLNNLITACMNCDGSNLATIESLVDINSAIDHYILVAMMHGGDNVNKNYLLSTYDGNKWFFTPYDMDGTWSMNAMGNIVQMSGGKFWVDNASTSGAVSFKAMANTHKLYEIIYKYMPSQLITRYKSLRRRQLHNSQFGFYFYNYASYIPKTAFDAEANLYPTIPSTNINNVNQILHWAMARLEALDNEIEQLEASIQ